MTDIIHIDQSEIRAEYREALQTHQRIMANGEICAQTLLEICKDLKKMRDEKLYAEFGYQTFDEYCEKMAGIKSRMAYNYISTYERLGSTVLQSNASLGITKLELIAGMNPIERNEMLENGDFEHMSTAEIKELVRKSKEQGEQISLLKTKLAEAQGAAENSAAEQQNTEMDALRKEVLKLQSELREKDDRHQAELSSAREEAAKAARAESSKVPSDAGRQTAEVQKQIEAAVAEAKKAAEKAAEKAAKEKVGKQLESQKSKIKDLEAALSASGVEKEKLEKQLSLSDTNSAKAMVYIRALQDYFNALFAVIGEMPDEQQNRFKGAVLKLVGAMQKQAEV